MKVEFRKYVPVVFFIVLIFLSYLIIKPFLLMMFLGALLAYIFYPLYRWGSKKLKNRQIAAVLICLVVLIILVIPSFFFIKALVKESYSLYLLGKQKMMGGFLFNDCGNYVCSLLQKWSSNPQINYYYQEGLKGITDWIIKKGSDLLVGIPNLLLNLFIVFFTLFYFLIDGKLLIHRLKNYLKMQEKKYVLILKRLKDILSGLVYGYVLVALIQGVFGALGFFIIGINSPLFWGMVMAILALIPYLGTGIIWIPASAILLFDGIINNSNILVYKGIGLFIYGLIFIAGIDNILRSKIIGSKAKMHPAVILIGILGGVLLMGMVGLIIGPLVLSLTVVIIESYFGKKLPEKK